MKKHTNIVGAFLLQAASTAVLFSSVAHVNAMETAKVVCGGGQGNRKCVAKNLETKVVSKDERYGARCCSDTPFFRSKLQDQFGCCVNGGTVTNVSGPGLELAHIDKGEEWFCPRAVTYAEAVQHCLNMDARICTEEELNNKCAKSTGCALNGALVWASTDEASTLCPTTSPSIKASSTPSVAASSTPSLYSSMSPSMEPSSTPTICFENVALGKQTAQSSNYQPGTGFSDVAVDGNTDGVYDNGSVTHTYTSSKDPWWSVDLGNGYLIDSIAVWNRNAYSERLADFVLTISRDGVDVYTYSHDGIPAAGGTANEIKLSQPVTGDKVKIQIFGEERILSLAEVQVFAFCGSEITPSPTSSPSIEASSTPSIAVSSTPSVYSSMSPSMSLSMSPSIKASSTPSVAASSTPSLYSSMSPSSTPTICFENVALGKQTAQSSNYQQGTGFSNVAVDGNTDGVYDNGSVTHTYTSSKDPWWSVDLENGYLIDSIAVWNRNAYSERLADFVLTISRDGVDVYTYSHDGIPAAGGTANEIKLSQPVTGDKVKIQIFGEERILSLAEVQVFAFCGSEIAPSPTLSPSIEASSTPSIAVSSTPSVYSSMEPSMEPSSTPTICVENVALDKPTEQNRDFQWGGGFSNLAVDGNTSGHFPDASVTHTYEWTKDPWWTVDLVNDYAIDSIAVWNRNNFYERLADFVLTISRDGVDVYTYTYDGIPAAGGTANEIKLSTPVTGDRVTIQVFGEYRILSLAEVQVFNFQCLD